MAIRQRRIEADYLKVAGKFEFLGTGFSTIDEKPSAQTRETRYVNDASSTTSVTSYKPEFDFESDQIESDKAIEYIVTIAKERKTGAAAETEYIRVDMDKKGTAENSFYARKFRVAIQVDEMPNNDGDLGANGIFLCQGDPEIGTVIVDPVTKDITFAKGFNEKTLEFSYVSTGTVTDISISGVTYDDTNDKFIGIPADTTSFTFKDATVSKTATLGSVWTIA